MAAGRLMNNRRKLVIALGAGALTAPFSSFAQQQGKVWRVGFLASRARPVPVDFGLYGEFLRGMRELNYIEDKNLIIEWRFSEGRAELLPIFAAELVRLKVDVIVVPSTPAASAAQKATASIPIVFVTLSDPVGSGFIKSLARPGGNITGLTNMALEITPKHLDMLRGVIPKLASVAVLMNADNSISIEILKTIQGGAQKAGIRILPVEVRNSRNIESAFPMMSREHAGAMIIVQDPLFTQEIRQVAELAAKYRLPAIGALREYAEHGILMSYGPNFSDIFRRAATHVDKIFKGTKPADLPVEQPTKFELFINGKTAKSLSLKIPQSLLIMADKVIE